MAAHLNHRDERLGSWSKGMANESTVKADGWVELFRGEVHILGSLHGTEQCLATGTR